MGIAWQILGTKLFIGQKQYTSYLQVQTPVDRIGFQLNFPEGQIWRTPCLKHFVLLVFQHYYCYYLIPHYHKWQSPKLAFRGICSSCSVVKPGAVHCFSMHNHELQIILGGLSASLVISFLHLIRCHYRLPIREAFYFIFVCPLVWLKWIWATSEKLTVTN